MRTLFALWVVPALRFAASLAAPRERSFGIEYSQQGAPLNYFVYPYVELDGGKYTSVDAGYWCEDLPLRRQQES